MLWKFMKHSPLVNFIKLILFCDKSFFKAYPNHQLNASTEISLLRDELAKSGSEEAFVNFRSFESFCVCDKSYSTYVDVQNVSNPLFIDRTIKSTKWQGLQSLLHQIFIFLNFSFPISASFSLGEKFSYREKFWLRTYLSRRFLSLSFISCASK